MASITEPQSSTIDDEYDRRAYQQILRTLAKHPSWFSRSSARVGDRIGSVGRKFAERAPAVATNAAESALRTALGGLKSLTIDPAFRSVGRRRVIRGYARHGVQVVELDELRHLSLRTIDEVMPALRWKYAAGAAVEGAGAAAVITGAELAAALGSVASAGTAAGPGAGAVVTAMAGDAAAVLAATARVVAHVGAYYGYDTRLPEEQVFALSVIGWSSASGEAAKAVAFRQMSLVTQQLVRGATWAHLSGHAMVRVIQELYVKLGFRLTKEKLGQAIPVLGVVIGAGLNAEILHSTATDAHLAYRLRHLVEKYEIDLGADTAMMPTDASGTDDIDVAEILEAAVEDSTELPEPQSGSSAIE